MSSTFSCPRCGQRYALKEGMGGKQANCKKCGASFRIEAAATPAASKPTTTPAANAPMPQLAAGGIDDLLNDAMGPQTPLAAQPVAAAAPSLAPSKRKFRKNGKLVWIGSAAGGVVLLAIILVVVMQRGGGSSPSPAPGAPTPTKLVIPHVPATSEIPAGVIAPADTNPNTVGGMKTPEQIVDEYVSQLDELARMVSAIRDEATMRDAIPKVAAQVSKINDTMSLATSPGMYSQRISPDKVAAIKAKQEQMRKQFTEEGKRLGAIPGVRKLLDELLKMGQIHAVAPNMPATPDAKTLATLPLEEQVKWYMRRKGPAETYAVVFEGLTPADVPRIEARLQPLNAHDGPTVFTGDRCLKYVSPVIKADMFVGFLNVGDGRANVAKRIIIIKIDRTKLQALPLPAPAPSAPQGSS